MDIKRITELAGLTEGQGAPLSTIEQMQKLAENSISVIERDGAATLSERQRKVIVHWMVRAMADARNAVIDEHEGAAAALLEKVRQGRLRV